MKFKYSEGYYAGIKIIDRMHFDLKDIYTCFYAGKRIYLTQTDLDLLIFYNHNDFNEDFRQYIKFIIDLQIHFKKTLTEKGE